MCPHHNDCRLHCVKATLMAHNHDDVAGLSLRLCLTTVCNEFTIKNRRSLLPHTILIDIGGPKGQMMTAG